MIRVIAQISRQLSRQTRFTAKAVMTRCASSSLTHQTLTLPRAEPSTLVDAITLRGISTSSMNCTQQQTFSTQGEQKIHEILKEKFPLATELEVKDISGGCGSMYEIYITSSEVSDHFLLKSMGASAALA